MRGHRTFHLAVQVALLLVLAGACCQAAGSHEGRDLAIRGMRMVARPGANRPMQARGWNLVAQGVAVLLSLPGEWELKEPDFRDHVLSFLDNCGRIAHLPRDYWAPRDPSYILSYPATARHTSFDTQVSGKPPSQRNSTCLDGEVTRDSWGTRDAVLITISLRYSEKSGPRGPAAQLLIGRSRGRMIAGGWREEVGCRPEKALTLWRHGRLAAFVHGNALWAVIAGYSNGGGTGAWPSAIALRSRGGRWQVVNRFDLDADDRGWKNGFSLRDVNGDGIPEIVGTISSDDRIDKGNGGDATGHPAAEYVIYKLVRGRYRNVWYARVNTPETVLAEFGVALCRRQWQREEHRDAEAATAQTRALSLVTSPAVLKQAEALGLGKGYLEVDKFFSDPNHPYGLVRYRGKHPQRWQWYRLALVKGSDGIWRIARVTRTGKTGH